MSCLSTKKAFPFFCLLSFLLIVNKSSLTAQTFSWAKPIAGTNANVASDYIGTDASGNLITLINFSGIADFDPGPAVNNLNSANGNFVIEKLSPTGSFVSTRQLNLPSSLRQVTLDIHENIFFTGAFSGTIDADPGPGTYFLTSAGYQDIFIVKLDPSGNFVWANRIGGEGIDEGNNIVINSLGNVYVTGIFGYVGNTSLNTSVDFDPDPSNNYILTSSGARDGFICCLDANGAFRWAQKQPVGTMYADPVGNIFLLGALGLSNIPSNTTYVSKIDADGNSIWSNQVSNTSLQIRNITANDAGEVLLAGGFNGSIHIGSYNISSVSMQDPFFAKLNASGNPVWAKSIKGNGFVQNISYGENGNLYLTGYFGGTGNVDFDPGPGVVNLNCKGNIAAFVEKVNSAGIFTWVRQIGGEAKSNTRGYRIITNSIGDIYTLLSFKGTVDFDPNPTKFNLTSKGQSDIVIHKMTQTIPPSQSRPELIVAESSLLNTISVYPNPNNGNFYINVPAVGDGARIEIYDMAGRMILARSFNGNIEQRIFINEKIKASGVYTVRIKGSNKIFNSKIVVE